MGSFPWFTGQIEALAQFLVHRLPRIVNAHGKKVPQLRNIQRIEEFSSVTAKIGLPVKLKSKTFVASFNLFRQGW